MLGIAGSKGASVGVEDDWQVVRTVAIGSSTSVKLLASTTLLFPKVIQYDDVVRKKIAQMVPGSSRQ